MSSTGSSLALTQCLFGYDDGHRLLACSGSLPDGVEDFLLEVTDLDPTAGSPTEGYLTGLPISIGRVYAVMRTWPAPEMPRPGCVWTHVILIDYADVARVQSLRVLESLLARPASRGGYADYACPLAVDISLLDGGTRMNDDSKAAFAIRALYGTPSADRESSQPEVGEDALFSLWSQQWPRLRRSFRFRSTRASAGNRAQSREFDLYVDPRADADPLLDMKNRIALSPVVEWEQVAASDLLGVAPPSFRRFLWRYGSDLRQSRTQFPFLVRLQMRVAVPIQSKDDAEDLLTYVAVAVPDPSDGMLLKKDLLALGGSSYSMLPAIDPLHLISFLASNSHAAAYPSLPDSAYSIVAARWHERATEILALTEGALEGDPRIGESLLGTLATLANPDDFLRISERTPRVREQLIRRNPDLLDTSYISTMDSFELVDLLNIIVDNQPIARRLLPRLLVRGDQQVVMFFARNFPGLCQPAVVDAAVSAMSVGAQLPIAEAWVNVAVIQAPANLLLNMERVGGTSSGLASCLWLAGFDIGVARQIPGATWVRAVLDGKDNVQGVHRLRFLSFLLTLCLERPFKGCEPLMERAFEEVHSAIYYSRLPSDSFEALVQRLPDVPWWQRWDSCFRLRLAAMTAYEAGGLDRASFNRLAKDPQLVDQLRALSKPTDRVQKKKRSP